MIVAGQWRIIPQTALAPMTLSSHNPRLPPPSQSLSLFLFTDHYVARLVEQRHLMKQVQV